MGNPETLATLDTHDIGGGRQTKEKHRDPTKNREDRPKYTLIVTVS